MASTNSPSARLSRSTSDLSDVRGQRTPGVGVSSTRTHDSKDTGALPRAKIQALEQFVKFGRKGQQEKSNQKAVEFPPPSWFDSTPSSTTSPSPVVATADSAAPTGNTTASAAPRRSTSSQLPPPPPSPRRYHTGSATGSNPPEIPPNPLRRATAETGSEFSRATSTVLDPPGTTQSPKLERRSSFPVPGGLDDEDSPPPEPLTLARRIQSLLSPRTGPQAPTPSVTNATTSSGATKSEATAPATLGDSIPPGPVPITDSRFLALLGNTTVMSGSLEKGRQSVFAILDRLRRPSAHATEASPGSASSSTPEEEQEEEGEEGDSSVMLYGPIIPSEGSEVELAASDIMSVFDDGETLEYEEPARPLSFFAAGEQFTPLPPPPARSPEVPEQAIQQETPANLPQPVSQNESGTTGWFDTWKGKVIDSGKLVSDKVTEGTKSRKDKVGESRKIVKTKTRWVPSPDKISFQVTWWGYRLYLPPPVLDVVNNKRLEAAKRAAIITTALQWLFSHVPLTLVPPQYRAGVLIAQRLVPYLGYIGGFAAWSWGAMKSFDKGQGMVLTATWLLPIALIPGTWEAPVPAPRGATPGARSPPDASTSASNSAVRK